MSRWFRKQRDLPSGAESVGSQCIPSTVRMPRLFERVNRPNSVVQQNLPEFGDWLWLVHLQYLGTVYGVRVRVRVSLAASPTLPGGV